jgi:hypothetical protein
MKKRHVFPGINIEPFNKIKYTQAPKYIKVNDGDKIFSVYNRPYALLRKRGTLFIFTSGFKIENAYSFYRCKTQVEMCLKFGLISDEDVLRLKKHMCDDDYKKQRFSIMRTILTNIKDDDFENFIAEVCKNKKGGKTVPCNVKAKPPKSS